MERLGYDFTVVPSRIDESRRQGESLQDMTLRLASEKVCEVRKRNSDAVIIGSDQVGDCQGTVMTKPGTPFRALTALNQICGKLVTFDTAVVVQGPDGTTKRGSVPTRIKFRDFSLEEIENYLELDEPFDCAGAIKSEGAASLLFEWVRSDDPSALIGLPLIKTSRFLREFGINPLSSTGAKP